VVLLGRWNWWPSRLSHEDHSHDEVVRDPGSDGPESGFGGPGGSRRPDGSGGVGPCPAGAVPEPPDRTLVGAGALSSD
jgi:hypothetical protein